MKSTLQLFILFFIVTTQLKAQKTQIELRFIDENKFPIEDVKIFINSNQNPFFAQSNGLIFLEMHDTLHTVLVNALGFENKLLFKNDLKSSTTIKLNKSKTLLKELTVFSKTDRIFQSIGKIDIKNRQLNNSQEILRLVPGLFIGQHQGGGKAEQIFMRGFDNDHGTDIAISADGMPVNMVSQAHGQGYADMHFIIPETVDKVEFGKGPYDADKGNFATSGYVSLQTKNRIDKNTIKAEIGMFNTARFLGIFNILNKDHQSLYFANELAYSDGFFDSPQAFNRLNIFSKYTLHFKDKHLLKLSAGLFNSTWNASGQIPDRAVNNHIIGFYGAIDPTEGGQTSRANLNLELISEINRNLSLTNQVFLSDYRFNLHSNFTFFLNDSVNGDQIRQKEKRKILGYTGKFIQQNKVSSGELAWGFRHDKVDDIELQHTINKFNVLNKLAAGDINESNLFIYANKGFKITQKINMQIGLRYDYFINHYKDHLLNDSSFESKAGILSPKLNIQYFYSDKVQYYIKAGKGFHSNDTRVCVIENPLQTLPAAYSADLGIVMKPYKNVYIQAAIWALYLEQEFAYSGDGGYAEPSGKTMRKGLDFSLRYEPFKYLFFDADVNYAHGRFTDEEKGFDYIPLAPVFSSTGGITLKNYHNLYMSLRYRYLSKRPGNETNTIIANSYFVNDLLINYTLKKFEIGLSIQNLFDVKWKETQFATESRLQNEPQSVEEIHFTAGTKFAARLNLTYTF